MRVERTGTRYFSFEELAAASNVKKDKKHNDEQLSKKKEKFLGNCPVCKNPMTYISGSNIIACQNESCRGYKHTRKDKEGKKINYYTPVFRVLDDKDLSYAEYLFNGEA